MPRMTIPVRMLAFMDGEIRNVEIPDGPTTPAILDAVFHYGQNYILNVPNRCSVSVGDVAEVNGEFWLVMPMGWRQLSADEFSQYEATPRHDRFEFIYLQNV
jgi:hypothetical protein